MTDAMKMPVPVADSQLSLKIASSIFGVGATGGIFWMTLCKWDHSILMIEIPPR